MSTDPTPPPPAGPKLRLGVLMFLQFFIWGAWFELGFDYIPKLGFDSTWQQPLIFGAFNVGALVAVFFSTRFADRTFAAEKFLAVSHLAGGAAILGLYFIRPDPADRAAVDAAFWPFFGLMLLHSVFYVPTLSIANAVVFANVADPAREFGRLRVWGTIGWIAAAWPFIFLLADWAKVPPVGEAGVGGWLGAVFRHSLEGPAAMGVKASAFLLAGIASFVLAGFCLLLPHTPPRPAAADEPATWVKALGMLRRPYVAVLFVVTFVDAAVHNSFFYWAFTYLGPKADGGAVDIPANWVGAVVKIGPVAEIVTMIFLGTVLKSLGWRLTMTVGVLGHAVRFAVFAYYPTQEAAVLINLIHGICYAFFFATVYIFVDEYFPKDIRATGQGLFNVLILGVGPFAANFVCGRLKTLYPATSPAGVPTADYPAVFEYSIAAGVAASALLLLFFHPPAKAADKGVPA